MTRPRKGQRVTLRFHGYDEEGQAVAWWDPAEVASGDPGEHPGEALCVTPGLWEIHAPGGARGEVGRVEIQHVSPHRAVAWARILEITKEAPWRVRPFDGPEHRCGGCPWGHLSAEEALRVKTERLRALQGAFPEARLGEPPVRPSAKTRGYRHRGKYVIGLGRPRSRGRVARRSGLKGAGVEGAGVEGADLEGAGLKGAARQAILLGAYAPRSHRVIRTLGCPVMCPAVDRAATILERLLARGPWPVYDETRREGLLRYVAIRSNHAEELLITLVCAQDPPGGPDALAPLVTELRVQVPELVGVTLDVNASQGNAIFSGKERVLFGVGAIWDHYGAARVKLTGHGFSQVNREQAVAMYEAARDAALRPLPGGARPRSIWELFAGAGALGQLLVLGAEDGEELQVLGVERDAASTRLALEAAEAAGLSSRLRFTAEDAGAAIGSLMAREGTEPVGRDASAPNNVSGHAPGQAPHPEVMVLDPPRSGCSPELMEALCYARVPRLVYLSCSPDTLTRDLRQLVLGGYGVRFLQGFDMMPMTPHLEILAVLERGLVAGQKSRSSALGV